MYNPMISPAGLMANGTVPWPAPVPEPGASNVMIVGCGPSKDVLLKFCTPSIAPPYPLVAGVAAAGLAPRAVCNSGRQAKRTAARRKTRANGEYVIGPVTQGIIVDSR